MSDTTTKERPIPFSPQMVKAILEGRKTVTRRALKVQPEYGVLECPYSSTGWSYTSQHGACLCRPVENPYGGVGDRLWVKEPYCLLWFNRQDGWQTFYKADDNTDVVKEAAKSLWISLSHMSREHARLFLEITDVRIERLQDITESDAHHEGWDWSNHDLSKKYDPLTMDTARQWFAALWDSLKGDKYPWSSNPWVWVISFRRIEAPR